MERPSRSAVVVTVFWMVGALASLWLSFSLKVTASAASEMGPKPWTAFLINIPWPVLWVSMAALLAAFAWGAVVTSRHWPWIVYAYAVFVVVGLAFLFWAGVVVPTNAILYNQL